MSKRSCSAVSTPSPPKNTKLEEPNLVFSNVPMELLSDILQFLDRDSIESCEIVGQKFKDLVSAYSNTLPLRSIFEIACICNDLYYLIKEQPLNEASLRKPLLPELAERFKNVVIQCFAIYEGRGFYELETELPTPCGIDKCVEDLKEIVKVSGKLIVKKFDYIQEGIQSDEVVVRAFPEIWKLMDAKEATLKFFFGSNIPEALKNPSLIEHPGLPPKVHISYPWSYHLNHTIFEMIDKSKFQSLDRRYTLELDAPTVGFCERYFELFIKLDGAPKMLKKIIFRMRSYDRKYTETDECKEILALLNRIPDIRVSDELKYDVYNRKEHRINVYEVEKEDGWVFRVEISHMLVYKVYHKNEVL